MLRRWNTLLGLVAAATCGGGCAGVGGPMAQRTEPLSAVAPVDLADQVAERAGEACGGELRDQLIAGARSTGDCDATEAAAARATILQNGVRFGLVSHRDVELDDVRLRLSEARLCRGWPLPLEDGAGVVLHDRDAENAGCLLRPYRGGLTITAVMGDGTRHVATVVEADRDGVAAFEFADVDAALRQTFAHGLDAYDWLELGESAWAGTVNLDTLRGYLADWHYAWVARGRGSAALFAERHAEHPGGPRAAAFALEGRVDRQRRDYDAVAEGKMSATLFLERHVWSPFRRAVEDFSVTADDASR
ncbi:MAG: hypothetical protein AAGA54_23590 [Myxococcota bacterium]